MNTDATFAMIAVVLPLYIVFTLVKFVVTDSQPVTMSEVGWFMAKIVVVPCLIVVLMDMFYQPDAATVIASKFPKAL